MGPFELFDYIGHDTMDLIMQVPSPNPRNGRVLRGDKSERNFSWDVQSKQGRLGVWVVGYIE